MSNIESICLCMSIVALVIGASFVLYSMINTSSMGRAKIIKDIKKRKKTIHIPEFNYVVPEGMHTTFFEKKVTEPMYQQYKYQCEDCKKEFILNIKPQDYLKWQKEDVRIQDAMPYLSPSERELLISNTCGDCFEKMMSLIPKPERTTELKCFITGSRVYGTPTEDSYIDLVIFLDSGNTLHSEFISLQDQRSNLKIMFGNLNIITIYDEDAFDAWQLATEDLIARKPVTREEAIKHIQETLEICECGPPEYATGGCIADEEE